MKPMTEGLLAAGCFVLVLVAAAAIGLWLLLSRGG